MFLLAGYELDPQLLRQRPGKLAILGWLISAVVAVGGRRSWARPATSKDYVPVGLALTTTALGTLLPILRDNDMLSGPFGQYVYAAGATGELFPILIIALFLLLAIASRFGLDVVLGALLAGIVLRAWTRRSTWTRSASSTSSTRCGVLAVNQPEIGEFTDAPTSVGASSWPS